MPGPAAHGLAASTRTFDTETNLPIPDKQNQPNLAGQDFVLSFPHDQHGAGRRSNHMFGDAAQEHMFESGVAVG